MIEDKVKLKNVWEIDEFIIQRAERWWKKAIQEKDPFDKFIAGWISFNTIYNLIARRREHTVQNRNYLRKEYNRVRFTIEIFWTRYNFPIYKNLVNAIQVFVNFNPPISYRDSPVGYNWISTYSQINSVQSALKKNTNTLDILIPMSKIIYAVRCNLFHGEKNEENARDIEVVKLSWIVMKNFYPNILNQCRDFLSRE